jgi:predicted TIM-barrel fold metal-dependent hydrolase
MSNSQRYQSAELFLSALLYGGVFDRHPKLTILIAELHAFWMPMFVRRHAGLTHKAGSTLIGEWPYPLSGDQYLHRQVRVSPLIGLGDFDALQVLQALPDMTVFSSDYPHTEGNADPIALYGEGLNQISPEVRERFMGGSMQERFAVMGDPLPLAA